MTGEPTKLYETNSPNWLPTLNLRTPVGMAMYKRITERVTRKTAYEELKEMPVVGEEVITEESKVIATMKLAGYIKMDVARCWNTECECANKIGTLQRKLTNYIQAHC